MWCSVEVGSLINWENPFVEFDNQEVAWSPQTNRRLESILEGHQSRCQGAPQAEQGCHSESVKRKKVERKIERKGEGEERQRRGAEES